MKYPEIVYCSGSIDSSCNCEIELKQWHNLEIVEHLVDVINCHCLTSSMARWNAGKKELVGEDLCSTVQS